MIGSQARAIRGNQDQAIQPVGPVDGRWIGGPNSFPWAATDAARGALSTTEGINGDLSHAGLLKTGPFTPASVLRQVPVIFTVYQLPPPAFTRQTLKLPLSMVNPKLAWSPS